MGLSGVTIVPAIIQKSWEDWQIVSVYKKLGARGLVCGFLPGDGPDPHKKDQMKAAANSLRPTFELAASLANAGFGQPDVCGPIHTLHRAKRTAEDIAMMDVWIYEELLALSKEYGTRVLFEPLNKIED